MIRCGVRRRARLARAAWLALLVALACSGRSPQPSNLVLISLDTTAPRRMSTYGAVRETTPQISALASRGVLFRNAYTVSPWTLPAHASMMTGLYPSSLAPNPNDERLYLVKPMLAQMFRERGYETAAVTGGFYTAGDRGLRRGFDSFAEDGVEAAIRWLERDRKEPFFLFFHSYVAHEPYTDRRYVRDGEGGRVAKLYRSESDRELSLQVKFAEIQPSDAEKEHVRALYDGGVAAADAMVGKIIETLRRLRLDDHTVVVVTSDHGEEFWEHTGRGAYHGHSLYDELLRIPLVWIDPQLDSVPRVVDAPVVLIDLVPTFLERFDLTPRSGLDGLDLRPLLRGEGALVERTLFAEGVRNGPPRSSIRARDALYIEVLDASIQNGKVLKPIPVLASEELYLAEDVGQQRNVANRYPALVARLKTELRSHQRRSTPAEPPVAVPALTREERRALESIGYLE